MTTYEAPTKGKWFIRSSSPRKEGLDLGIDPGLQTGWALLDGKEIAAAGVIDVRDSRRPFHDLRLSVASLLSGYAPGRAFMEEGFLPAGASSSQAAQLRGAIKAALEERFMRYREVNPMRVRAMTGATRISDAERRRMLCGYFQVPEKFKLGGKGQALTLPCHIIDSAAVAWAGAEKEKA